MRWLSFLIIAILFPSKNVSAQGKDDFSFMFNFLFMESEYLNYPWNDFIKDYPEFNLNPLQFDNYSTYGTPSPVETGQNFIPLSFAVEFGKRIKAVNSAFWDRSSHRFRLTIEGSSFFENNSEYTASVDSFAMYPNMVYRDFYEVEMRGTFLHAMYGIHHFSNYKGKAQNYRLWVGLSIIEGAGFNILDLSHHEGIYEKKTLENGTYTYYTNTNYPIAYTLSVHREIRWLNGFAVPFGVERICGKRKRTHLGFEYSFGNVWMISFGKKTISSSYFSGGFNCRFDLK